MASSTAPATIGSRLLTILVSVAAALVILGVSIVPFFSPAWIHGEEDRSGAPALFGAAAEEVHSDADAIVHDLILGGEFDVGAGRLQPVLDPKEQAHMRDVRGVFQGLALLVLAGTAVLVASAIRARAGGPARRAWWRAVARGGRWLAVLMVAIGVLSVVAFDAAFQVFHELLFPAGSFTFDPATERLVQLFPDQFWSDTTLALGLVTIGLSIVVAWVAGSRANRADVEAAVQTPGTASPLTPRSIP